VEDLEESAEEVQIGYRRTGHVSQSYSSEYTDAVTVAVTEQKSIESSGRVPRQSCLVSYPNGLALK